MTRSKRTRLIVALTVSLLGLAVALPAAVAQARRVTLNGQALSDAQIARLDALQCARIPDGRYWLDLQTGLWGYAGNPRAQGLLGEMCRNGPSRPGLSERRQLYRPGEILSGN